MDKRPIFLANSHKNDSNDLEFFKSVIDTIMFCTLRKIYLVAIDFDEKNWNTSLYIWTLILPVPIPDEEKKLS